MRRALLLLLLVVPVAACGSDVDDAPSAASSTTTTSSTTSTSTPALELGDPLSLGDGTLVGAHPSAPIAYVSIVDRTTDQVGCEGGDVARLWAQPLAAGDAVRALPDSFLSGIVLSGGDGGTVAVVDQCEGFLSSLTTARPKDDGTFADVVEIDTTAAEAEGQLMPSTIRWAPDGRSFLALVHDLEGDGVRAVRIALDGSVADVTVADGDGLLAVEELADHRLVVATDHGVTIGDGPAVALDVTSIALDPERVLVAVFGAAGTTVLRPDIAPVTIDDRPSTVGSWSPSSDAIAYLGLDGDQSSVWLSEIDGGSPVLVDGDGGFGAPVFSDDGAFVLYNDAVDDGQGFAMARATARPLGASSTDG